MTPFSSKSKLNLTTTTKAKAKAMTKSKSSARIARRAIAADIAAMAALAAMLITTVAASAAFTDPALADEAEAAMHPAPTYLSAAPERPKPVPAEAWSGFVWQGIELDLHGRHDEADAIWNRLEATGPNDPEPWLRRVDTVYWRHFYDEGRGLDGAGIRPLLDRARSLAEARLKADRHDLRARWLLGEVLMQQARYEGMTGNYVKAGTLGERGRKHLELVLADDPDHSEAGYTLGLYYYFASLMPNFVRAMNWLWFVPKGDRDLGLALLERARAASTLYGPSAAMVLMTIHTYHDPPDVPAAVEIAHELHAAYPSNAILHFELIEVLLKARQHDALIAEALALERRRGESEGVTHRAMLARIWRARAAVERGQLDEARAIAFGLDFDDPDLPEWGAPWLWLVRGQILDLEGDRPAALDAYDRVLALGTDDFFSQRPQRIAKAGRETPFAAGSDLDGPVIGSRN